MCLQGGQCLFRRLELTTQHRHLARGLLACCGKHRFGRFQGGAVPEAAQGGLDRCGFHTARLIRFAPTGGDGHRPLVVTGAEDRNGDRSWLREPGPCCPRLHRLHRLRHWRLRSRSRRCLLDDGRLLRPDRRFRRIRRRLLGHPEFIGFMGSSSSTPVGRIVTVEPSIDDLCRCARRQSEAGDCFAQENGRPFARG